MRSIPRHVLLRNRNTAEADRNGQYYNRGTVKTGGPCARCGKSEDEHFAGSCDDWGAYTPKKPAEAVRE